MINILVGGVISFLAAFGLMELLRYMCIWFGKGEQNYHVVVLVKNEQNTVEGKVRGVLLATGAPVFVVDLGSTDNTIEVLLKLQQRNTSLTLFTYEEYLHFLTTEDD